MREGIQKQLKKITPKLNAYALYLTTDMEEAADLYQDTVLRILLNLNKFKEGSNFQAWATTIMRNIFINGYRKKIRKIVFNDPTENGYYLNSQRSVLNTGTSSLAIGELMEFIQKLPTKFSIPFWMVYEGYKYEEIAETLDIPLGTVKSRVFFAKQKLQARCNAIHLSLSA